MAQHPEFFSFGTGAITQSGLARARNDFLTNQGSAVAFNNTPALISTRKVFVKW